MSTKVAKVVKCDRCKKTKEVEVCNLPVGWVQMTGQHGKTDHLCEKCAERALAV